MIKLNNKWKLRYEPIYFDKENYTKIIEKKDNWFEVKTLPCPVHITLIENKIIKDPSIADNNEIVIEGLTAKADTMYVYTEMECL